MLSKIPSWGVGLAGAVIAIAATIASSTLLYQTRGGIADARSEIADKRGRVERLWSSHRQADQRATAADMFLAQALGPGAGRSFLLEQAAAQMRGAALSMWVASGESVPDKTPGTITDAEQLLIKGDVGGYSMLRSETDRLRLLSQTHLNGLGDEIRAAESRVASLVEREFWLYLAYVFLNLLALMVTMCKDLPVWRDERRGLRAG